MAVTLINVFSVPSGKEDEFVKWWHDVKANITKRPGFISGKFHKSLKPRVVTTSSILRSGRTKICIGRPMSKVRLP